MKTCPVLATHDSKDDVFQLTQTNELAKFPFFSSHTQMACEWVIVASENGWLEILQKSPVEVWFHALVNKKRVRYVRTQGKGLCMQSMEISRHFMWVAFLHLPTILYQFSLIEAANSYHQSAIAITHRHRHNVYVNIIRFIFYKWQHGICARSSNINIKLKALVV